ncbi:MAG TPA: MiaB/RimO family radical SAM methylthiotransferase [bacterium]|nr:MiaB/RimO family radical SAM methylthiotransferase [bacterium]
MKSVAFATLGCKANYVDTEAMVAACRGAGLLVVPFEDEADAYVVNTCTVTSTAYQQSRQMLRRPGRARPGAIVVAVGCAAEVDRESLAACGIDAVFGTKDRGAALAYLFRRLGIDLPSRESRVASHDLPQSRARAFLKIQDGCDRGCAYCIVPRARGPAVSVPPDEIESSCLALSRNHREIVLTGIDVGQYRHRLARGSDAGLLGLLARLASVEGMPRLRLSSIDPTVVTDEFASFLAASKRVCRHIHLSVQSGSGTVLRRMGRGYGAGDIERAVILLKERVEGIAVTADLIAGFPGETDEEHRSSAELVKRLSFAGLHVFPYSEREGTPAASMPGRVEASVRKERAAELRAVARESRRAFLESQIGRPIEAIVTSRAEGAGGTVKAFTDNAVSVTLPSGAVSYGEIGAAVITSVCELEAFGKWE